MHYEVVNHFILLPIDSEFHHSRFWFTRRPVPSPLPFYW